MEWTAPLGQISRQQGEFVASSYGVEGSLIYAASADLRKSIQAQGSAEFKLDLLPDWPLDKVVQAVSHPRGSRSLSSHLKGRLGIEGIKMALLNELLPPEVLRNSAQLALAIKGLSIKLTAARPMDEAISTAGGVAWDGLDEGLQTKVMPGVYVAGEMLDWEAPTGGYLLTACMATGYKAALSVHAEMKGDEP
jgi:predicted flavoprotein YhiN